MSKKHDALIQIRVKPENIRLLRDLKRDMSRETGLSVSLNAVANLVLSRYFASKQRQP